MRLLQLKLAGFRSYDHLSLDLSRLDKVAIVGRNGAGKSTILKAIAWAPFGEGSADDLISRDRDHMSAELTFSLGDQTFRITRTRDRGKKSLLALEQHASGDVWQSLSEAKIVETQAKINRLLGSAEVFTSSVYSPQNQVGAFLALRAGERKAMLGELLDLGRWEGWREEASAEARACAGRAQSAAGAVTAVQARITALQSRIIPDPDEVEKSLQTVGAELEGIEADLEAAAQREKDVERVERRKGLEREIKSLLDRGRLSRDRNARRKDLAEAIAGMGDADATFAELSGRMTVQQTHLASARAKTSAAEQANASRAAKISLLERSLADAEGTAESLGASADAERAKARQAREAPDGQPCPTCGQAVDGEHRELVAKSHDVAAEALGPKMAQAMERASQLFTELEEAQAVPVQEIPSEPHADPELAQALNAATTAVADLRRLEGQLDGLGEHEDTTAMKAEYERLKVEAEALPTEVAPGETPAQVRARQVDITARARQLEERLREHRDAAAQAQELGEQMESHQRDQEHEQERQRALEVCARAFGRDGIPAMILDGMVGSIEAAANAALEQFGSQMRIQLTTQREKKSGGVAETLDVVVDDGAHEAPIDSFSGGEQYRVAIALRLAIADVLGASRMECLLIDEITDLDHDGAAALIDILTQLDRQVLVVSHASDEIAALPQQLAVSRNGLGPSTVALR